MEEALVDFFATGTAPEVERLRRPQHQITIETIFRALDLVPTPILVGMDPEAKDIRSNVAGRELYGGGNRNLSLSADESSRPDFVVYSDGRLVPPDDLPMQRAALTGRPVESSECELRFEDGTIKFIRGRAVPVVGRDGRVRGSIGVFLDVTEARETEKRHFLMAEEVKHRAKNALAVVNAVARLTLKPKLGPSTYREFEERLQVIGRSVDVFTAEERKAQTVAQFIADTIGHQLGSDMSRINMAGPELFIPLRSMTSLGMVIHELTTNACKYGALSVSTGQVLITWEKLEGVDVLAMDWIERGGPPVVPPTKKGFGSRLLSEVLGSPAGRSTKIRFGVEGVECRMHAALT